MPTAGALGTEMLASAIYAPVTVAAHVSGGIFTCFISSSTGKIVFGLLSVGAISLCHGTMQTRGSLGCGDAPAICCPSADRRWSAG